MKGGMDGGLASGDASIQFVSEAEYPFFIFMGQVLYIRGVRPNWGDGHLLGSDDQFHQTELLSHSYPV
jgi:hypothetical protein